MSESGSPGPAGAHQWVLLHEYSGRGSKRLQQPTAVSDDPQGQLLLGIQGLFAEYERAMITERCRRCRSHRIGVATWRTPMRPTATATFPSREPGGGHWELEPPEADVVRRIYAGIRATSVRPFTPSSGG